MLPSLTRHNGKVTKAWCLSVTRQVRVDLTVSLLA